MKTYTLYICILFYLSHSSGFIESTSTDPSLSVSTPAEPQSEDSTPVSTPSSPNDSDSTHTDGSATQTQTATSDSSDSGNLKVTDQSQGGGSSSGSEPNTDPKKIAEDQLNKLKSEVKLFKPDPSDPNNTVELANTEYSSKKGFYQDEVDFILKEGVSCTLVRCNDKDVWKYDSSKFGGSHPTVISYVAKSKLVVYFKTKYILHEKNSSDDWGVAPPISNLSISNLANGASQTGSKSDASKTGAGLNEASGKSADGDDSGAAGSDVATKGSDAHSPEEVSDAHTDTSTPSSQPSPALNPNEATLLSTPPMDLTHISSVDTSGFGISWDFPLLSMDPNTSAHSFSPTDSSDLSFAETAETSSASEGSLSTPLPE